MFVKKLKDIVGIDIGSNSVKLVQFKEQKGTYTLVKAGIAPLPPEAIVDNSLMDSASIVETLRGLLRSLNVTAKDAACSISGNAVIIRKIVFPTMPQDEMEDQIQWEAEQYIPFEINDVNIDFQILGIDEFDPAKMNVLLVASKKDIIQDYIAVFNEAGLKMVVMDVDSFAVQNAFEINYEIEPDSVVALVNIGASITNYNIVRNGISLFTRDVQMGGNFYTEEIQKQFGVSTEDAEKIKVTGNAPDLVRLHDILVRGHETVAMEMRRSLDFYNSTAGDDKISKIYLSGGASKTSMLVESVSQRLGLPVEIIDPFQKVVQDDKEFDTAFLSEIGPLMTVAVGLATRRLGDK